MKNTKLSRIENFNNLLNLAEAAYDIYDFVTFKELLETINESIIFEFNKYGEEAAQLLCDEINKRKIISFSLHLIREAITDYGNSK